MTHITSKIHTVVIFLIVDIDEIFNAEFVGMYTIYLLTRFHIPKSNDSMIAIKMKAKYKFK
jgi:hypothetical protein